MYCKCWRRVEHVTCDLLYATPVGVVSEVDRSMMLALASSPASIGKWRIEVASGANVQCDPPHREPRPAYLCDISPSGGYIYISIPPLIKAISNRIIISKLYRAQSG